MKKTNHTQKKYATPTKPVRMVKEKPSWMDNYSELFIYRQKPVPQAFIDRICEEMIEYAHNLDEEFLTLEWFFSKKSIPSDLVFDWTKAHSDFNEVYNHAKRIIGWRRENGALRKQFAESTAHLTMSNYLKEWPEYLKERAKNTKPPEDTQVAKFVVLSDSNVMPKDEEENV